MSPQVSPCHPREEMKLPGALGDVPVSPPQLWTPPHPKCPQGVPEPGGEGGVPVPGMVPTPVEGPSAHSGVPALIGGPSTQCPHPLHPPRQRREWGSWGGGLLRGEGVGGGHEALLFPGVGLDGGGFSPQADLAPARTGEGEIPALGPPGWSPGRPPRAGVSAPSPQCPSLTGGRGGSGSRG